MAIKRGSNRSEKLTGTQSADQIFGLNGNDTLIGLNGNDRLDGGGGNDVLRGGKGNDVVLGGSGNDTLFGDGGNDVLDGGSGRDELLGGDGNDLLLPGGASDGADALDGGAGSDTVSYANITPVAGVGISIDSLGSLGNMDAAGDTYANIENFIGSSGADVIVISAGRVANPGVVAGGAEDDRLFAEGFVMRGDAGNDDILMDILGTVVDTVWLQLNQGLDEVFYFEDGQDRIRISGAEFGIGALLNSDELVNRFSDNLAQSPVAQFIFRQDTDQLFFDPDGTGAQAPILLTDFGATSPIFQLSLSDFEIV